MAYEAVLKIGYGFNHGFGQVYPGNIQKREVFEAEDDVIAILQLYQLMQGHANQKVKRPNGFTVVELKSFLRDNEIVDISKVFREEGGVFSDSEVLEEGIEQLMPNGVMTVRTESCGGFENKTATR